MEEPTRTEPETQKREAAIAHIRSFFADVQFVANLKRGKYTGWAVGFPFGKLVDLLSAAEKFNQAPEHEEEAHKVCATIRYHRDPPPIPISTASWILQLNQETLISVLGWVQGVVCRYPSAPTARNELLALQTFLRRQNTT